MDRCQGGREGSGQTAIGRQDAGGCGTRLPEIAGDFQLNPLTAAAAIAQIGRMKGIFKRIGDWIKGVFSQKEAGD